MPANVLIILGMHRSGTSVTARLINLLGVDLGNRIMGPAPSNPKGFWEHADISNLHDRMLRSMEGREWHSTLPLPRRWWLSQRIRPFRDEILSMLKRDFSDSPFWGIKDPRMARLLPLWKSILDDLECKPLFLHVIRNPIEVAASLETRDGFSLYKSILLWFNHVSEAEAETRGFPRSFVTFPQLLADWQSAVRRVARELEIEWPVDPGRIRRKVETFIDTTLKHHSESDVELLGECEIPPYVTNAYLELVKAAEQPDRDVSTVLSRSSEEFKKARQKYFPVFGMMNELLAGQLPALRQTMCEQDAAHAELYAEVPNRQTEVAWLRAELASIKSSRSWRLTAPLRMAAKVFRQLLGVKPPAQNSR